MAIFGIDEAGRGPVLGSMFIGIVKIDSMDELQGDIKDSKNLTYNQIHSVAKENEEIEHLIVEVTPDEIDAGNLTNVAINKMGEGLQELGATDSDIIFADACLSNEQKFTEELAKAAELDKTSIIGENGADDTYTIVGMASIFAKSGREEHIDKLQEKSNYEIGSGYPSDPTTREYLATYIKEHGSVPESARKSWSTCEDLLEEHTER